MVNKDRLVKTLIDLIKIDSPSGEEKAVGQEVANRLQGLGCRVEFDSFGNLLAYFPGEGPLRPLSSLREASEAREPILLGAHLDTVEPGRGIKPIVNKDTIKTDGTTILGADPKAGIAIILEALTLAKEKGLAHLPVEVVLTREEESGLSGALNLDYSKLVSKVGVIFDGDEEVFKVFKSGPGYIRVDATIIGKAAHSGVAPEKGISAIKIASEIISRLNLGRIDFETTANIGLISGGSARNAVPERVAFKGEIRSRNKAKLMKQAEKLQQTFDKVMKEYPQAQLVLDLHEEFQSFKMAEDHQIMQKVSQALKALELKPEFIDSGGGTDANIMHAHGIAATIVGTGDYDLHTTSENLNIPQFVQAAEFALKLITI